MSARENVVASRLSKLMLSNGQGGSTSSEVQSPVSPGEQSLAQSELNQLKRDADPQFSRFADYFVICGLDLDTGLEPDRFAGELNHRWQQSTLYQLASSLLQATTFTARLWIEPTRASP